MKFDTNIQGDPRKCIVCKLSERGHTVKHPQGDYKSPDKYRMNIYDSMGHLVSWESSWRWGDDLAHLMRKYPDYKVFLNDCEVK